MAEIHNELLDSSNETVKGEFADCMGCTACVVIITNEEIVVANSGDSRCVLCKSGIALALTDDHKPELETEKARIENAGGFIDEDNRVNGSLSLTRSLGDLQYKKNLELGPHEQLIISKPDIRIERIENECEFIVLACDGIWECMSSQRAVEYIREQIAKYEFMKIQKPKLSKIIERMFEKNITNNIEANTIGGDNMTCIIIKFKKT